MIKIKPLLEQAQLPAARVLDRLPTFSQRALVKLLAYPYDYPELDPLTACLMALKYKQGKAGFLAANTKMTRQNYEKQINLLSGCKTLIHQIQDLRLPLASGTLKARHYHPNPNKKLAMLVFYHGGGFVAGSLETHDEICRMFAKAMQVQVLSVQYPLAPESSPQQVIDACQHALQWVYENRRQLNIYKGRIAVAGDSAGGNICAVVAARSINTVYAPQAQLLIYPAIDFKCCYPSIHIFGYGLTLTACDVAQVKDLYAQQHHVELDDPIVSPIYAELNPQLAATFIVTAGHDVLHDEATFYAEKLAAHGCKVQYQNYLEQAHGFLHLTPISRQARKRSLDIAKQFKKFWFQQT
jgi:acetyl esterase